MTNTKTYKTIDSILKDVSLSLDLKKAYLLTSNLVSNTKEVNELLKEKGLIKARRKGGYRSTVIDFVLEKKGLATEEEVTEFVKATGSNNDIKALPYYLSFGELGRELRIEVIKELDTKPNAKAKVTA